MNEGLRFVGCDLENWRLERFRGRFVTGVAGEFQAERWAGSAADSARSAVPRPEWSGRVLIRRGAARAPHQADRAPASKSSIRLMPWSPHGRGRPT
jgi:hypothetical protein